VLRTTDGGKTWKDVSPPGSEGLLFRDLEAESAQRASVLSIGNGDDSRIYTTTDGGRRWRLAFVNDDPDAFYDSMDFFDGGRRGLALSDPVDGRFRILGTFDSGRSWHVLPTAGMPDAIPGEFAFAASGTCLVAHGDRDAWFATGGGDFLLPDNGADASGFTRNGDDWHGGGDLSGYRSGVDWLFGSRSTLVAVGPTGSDITYTGRAAGAPSTTRHTTRSTASRARAGPAAQQEPWRS
jgi:photosystem II stability/assembly factor-like uncharacterized protein